MELSNVGIFIVVLLGIIGLIMFLPSVIIGLVIKLALGIIIIGAILAVIARIFNK